MKDFPRCYRDAVLELEGKGRLVPFVGDSQAAALRELLRGQEGQFFVSKVLEYAHRVSVMPVTYEQEGKGDEAIAYLHYFIGGYDWYITERDVDTDGQGQLQAFGLACITDVELGYIDLVQILDAGAELDLHFTPTRIGDLKDKHRGTGEGGPPHDAATATGMYDHY